jgi:hypothetical protein
VLRGRIVESALIAGVFAACAGRTSPSGTGGGAGGGNSLFVQGVIYPTPQGVGTPCTYVANPSQIFESSGTLDLDLRDQYSAPLLIGNGDAGPVGTIDTNAEDVELQGASIAVTDARGNPLGSFTSLATGYVYAPIGGTPGYSVLQVTILDSMTGESLKGMVSPGHDARVVASLEVFGSTRSGVRVQSDTFAFPIDVCEGCLVSFAPEDMDPSLPEPNCANWQQAASGPMTVPCVMGQDTAVDCSECQQFPVCHGSATSG